MKKNIYKEISIIIITFKSNHIIEKCLKNINKKFNIIIIENSSDVEFKKYIEKKYKNIKVKLAQNIGFGAAINLGAKMIKTKFFLSINPDTILNNDILIRFYEGAKIMKNNFLAFGPEHTFYNEEDFKINYKTETNKINFTKTNFINGSSVFFCNKNFKKINGFDEKIFMYYEETDIFKRGLQKKLGIFLVSGSKILHLSQSSSNPNLKKKIEINRNWHFMWSRFYFYTKHYGYFFSFVFNFPTLIRSLIKIFYYNFININFNKKNIYKARFNGMINSMILKKSWFRIEA